MVGAGCNGTGLAHRGLGTDRQHDGAQRVKQRGVLVVVGMGGERQHVLDHLGEVALERGDGLGPHNFAIRRLGAWRGIEQNQAGNAAWRPCDHVYRHITAHRKTTDQHRRRWRNVCQQGPGVACHLGDARLGQHVGDTQLGRVLQQRRDAVPYGSGVQHAGNQQYDWPHAASPWDGAYRALACARSSVFRILPTGLRGKLGMDNRNSGNL